MVEPLKPGLSRSVAREVAERRDSLLGERFNLLQQRAELLTRLRRVDRELADCRATARFFGLDIEFPATEEDRWGISGSSDLVPGHADLAVARQNVGRVLTQLESKIAARLAAPSPIPAHPRPTVREYILSQLAEAGAAGMKGATLREGFERLCGVTLHEKTVGMTLYRLFGDKVVDRKGHIWFLRREPDADKETSDAQTPEVSEAKGGPDAT